MKNNRLLLILIALLAIWNIFSVAYYQSRLSEKLASNEITVNNYTVSGFSTDLTGVVAEARSGVVTVEANAVATGFIYKSEGEKTYVLTAYHAVEDAGNIFLTFDSGLRSDASLLGYDIFADIAVLECELPFETKTLKIGMSENLKDGEFLILIGSPVSADYRGSVELTMVSNRLCTLRNGVTLDELGQAYDYFGNYIQLSDDLQNGYSGAALLNMNGEAVGVVTMKDPEAGFSFAVPIDEVKIIADKIIKGEEYRKSLMDLKGSFISAMANYERSALNLPLEVTDGFYVREVKENGFSFFSGIRPGDVILSVNEQTLGSYSDLLAVQYSGADEFVYRIVRGGETMEVRGSLE